MTPKIHVHIHTYMSFRLLYLSMSVLGLWQKAVAAAENELAATALSFKWGPVTCGGRAFNMSMMHIFTGTAGLVDDCDLLLRDVLKFSAWPHTGIPMTILMQEKLPKTPQKLQSQAGILGQEQIDKTWTSVPEPKP